MSDSLKLNDDDSLYHFSDFSIELNRHLLTIRKETFQEVKLHRADFAR